MRIVICSPELSDNSLGRAYSLGLAAAISGHRVSVIGRGGPIWRPVLGTPFADACRAVTGADDPVALGAVRRADVIVSLKVWPESLVLALRLGRAAGVPVIVDVDDPDIEATLAQATPRDMLRVQSELTTRSRHPLALRAARALARRRPVMVSNPTLLEFYDGTVVPHVREQRPPAPVRDAEPLVIAFVGTPHRHKGIDHLRAAVRAVHHRGVELLLTAHPPHDAEPWERWVGPTSLAEGLELVDRADVIAIPSLATWYGPYQFPVKLVDAMMAGRAIVASDLPPIRWVLGDAGMLVPPGDVAALAESLTALHNPDRRAALGRRAWQRALREFSAEAGSQALQPVLEAAVDQG